MEYRIFQYGSDDVFICEIVKTLSCKYSEVKESEE